MIVSSFKVGYLRCNCYLININDKYLLVDPGDDYYKIVEKIKNKDVIGILLTHSHFDHTACANSIANLLNIPIYYSGNLKEGKHNIGDFKFDVINTFGHTMDSITFYFYEDNIMFTGDFLFNGTIGRCDLPESDYGVMLNSISKIKKYDDEIIVYPGHGSKTTLGNEKKFNTYFK